MRLRARSLPLALALVLVQGMAGIAPALGAGPTGVPASSASPSGAQPNPGAVAKGGRAAAAMPAAAQSAPDLSVRPRDADRFEYGQTAASIPRVVLRQLFPLPESPAESALDPRYFGTADGAVRRLTLKEAVYLALRNNPRVKAARLDPMAATEGLRMANGVFDPDFIAGIDTVKTVLPATTPLFVKGTHFVTKEYDWNFTLNKVLRTTDGVLTLSFTNDRMLTNSLFQGVSPAYTPILGMGLMQPLLRNFGWEFATIHVRLAESAQRRSQFYYAQALNDFVQQVGVDYWNVVAAEENRRVAQEALRFNRDLVRVNRVSVQAGVLAPIELAEAQAAEATAEANVYAAIAALKGARAALREDVMLNPRGVFVPEKIEPADRPNPSEPVNDEEERSLELAVEKSPSLAALREAIRGQLLQVKYQKNQLLPSFNLSSQFAVNSLAGRVLCLPTSFGGAANCTIPPSAVPNGVEAPFFGDYGTALNRMFGFRFYSYTIFASFEMPLDNAPISAAIAQAKVGYRQLREQYRAALAGAVVQVETALAKLGAGVQQVKAAQAAVGYARQALHDEQVRFRVGMATTHDLLQFQSAFVSAEGGEVSAETELEKAKLALRHADNTLLASFQVKFELSEPREIPWYAAF